MDSTFKGTKDQNLRVETLQPADFPSWNELVNTSPHGTVFHYSWWLEATGYDFEILICRDNDGRLLAGIPLPRKKRAGLTLFHSPLLTPYLGPIFDLSKATSARQKLSMMRRVGEFLARGIGGYDSMKYRVGATSPDLQGFLWAGFRAELGYTFRFESGTSVEQIRERMGTNPRRDVVKAERLQMTVEVADNIDVLIELLSKTFDRQGSDVRHVESHARRLWTAARSRQQADIYLARSSQGQYSAGLLIIYDSRTSYLILAGADHEMRALGSVNLLEWYAIQASILAGRAFDFEGSTIPGVEAHYRRWGAIATPVYDLIKAGSRKGMLAQLLKSRGR